MTIRKLPFKFKMFIASFVERLRFKSFFESSLIIALFFLTVVQLIAQNKLSELKNQLTHATTDSSRCHLLMALGVEYYDSYRDSAAFYLKSAEKLAEQAHLPHEQGLALYELGYLYSSKFVDESTALRYLKKGIDVATPIQDNYVLAIVYQRIGIIMENQHQPNSEELLLKSINYAQKTDSLNVIARSNNFLASVYSTKKKYFEAEKYLKKTLDLSYNKNSREWIRTCSNYAELCENQGKIPEAQVYYQKGLSYIQERQMAGNNFMELLCILQIEIKTKHYDLMNETFNRFNLLNTKSSRPDSSQMFAVYSLLSDAYVAQGNYNTAYSYLKKALECATAVNIRRFNESSQLESVKITDALDLLKKEEEIKTQKIFLGGFILLSGMLVFLAFYINRSRKKLNEINHTKDKLFAIVAHDLRSPIGALKTYLSLINFGIMPQAEFATASQKLTTNINALFQTLDNLLHWSHSQLRGIKAKPETIPLYEVANDEIKFLTEMAHQKNISIEINISTQTNVFADRNQLGLIIRNLVSNSLKFTNSGGKVILESSRNENDKILLKITDTGIGMPKEIQNQLFKIGENTSRHGTFSEKGQGLGLILVKEMVATNNGTLVIETVEHRGTTINILLPSGKTYNEERLKYNHAKN